MRDLAQKWTAVPDWRSAVVEGRGLTVRTRTTLNQYLVSGQTSAWSAATRLPASGVGAFGKAKGDHYCVQVARDRLLAVSTSPLDIETGWHRDGFCTTSVTAGWHVFEAEGAAIPELIARATPLDPRTGSASASLAFAGVNAVVYHHDTSLRIHVERGLATYLWTWLETITR